MKGGLWRTQAIWWRWDESCIAAILSSLMWFSCFVFCVCRYNRKPIIVCNHWLRICTLLALNVVRFLTLIHKVVKNIRLFKIHLITDYIGLYMRIRTQILSVLEVTNFVNIKNKITIITPPTDFYTSFPLSLSSHKPSSFICVHSATFNHHFSIPAWDSY